MINKIKNLVKNETDELDWKYHIHPVVIYSKKLAKQLKADEELVEISALLHDIGRFKFGPENHEKTSAKEAEQILKELNYPKDKIKKILDYISTHGGDSDNPPKTIEAEILMNADAMAHINSALFMFYKKSKEKDFQDTIDWVNSKMDKAWTQKLTLSEAKKIMKKKYNAIKIVLSSIKDISDYRENKRK